MYTFTLWIMLTFRRTGFVIEVMYATDSHVKGHVHALLKDNEAHYLKKKTRE